MFTLQNSADQRSLAEQHNYHQFEWGILTTLGVHLLSSILRWKNQDQDMWYLWRVFCEALAIRVVCSGWEKSFSGLSAEFEARSSFLHKLPIYWYLIYQPVSACFDGDVDQALFAVFVVVVVILVFFVLLFYDSDDNVVEAIFGSLYNYLFASGESVEVGKMWQLGNDHNHEAAANMAFPLFSRLKLLYRKHLSPTEPLIFVSNIHRSWPIPAENTQ